MHYLKSVVFMILIGITGCAQIQPQQPKSIIHPTTSLIYVAANATKSFFVRMLPAQPGEARDVFDAVVSEVKTIYPPGDKIDWGKELIMVLIVGTESGDFSQAMVLHVPTDTAVTISNGSQPLTEILAAMKKFGAL